MLQGTLFSSYFLEEGIKTTEDWKRLSDNKVNNAFAQIKELISGFQEREKPDEADTEDGLIVPILELLGFQWSRQKSPDTTGRHDVPDFVLFPNREAKKEFDKKEPKQKPWDKAVCILEGKRWKRALDKRDNTDPLDRGVPSNQILRYLSSVEIASNGKIIWGILTNGEVWRLYYHRALSRSEGFIEFNLEEIVNENNIETFKIFYLLFRKEAFIPTEWRPYITFLEIALNEGKRWEERVSESLKERIFDEIFIDIAKGFLKSAKEKGRSIDDKLLEEVYNNTLILLYRILFLMYAEDRDLLPVRKAQYKTYSLSRIREEIAEIIDTDQTLSETITLYWDRLKNLFKIINNGDIALKIPPYNGGLFNPEKHPFLEKFAVPDKFLVPAIDKLSRDYHAKPYKRINYRDLSVRQLGSIYEGLLEFSLKKAKENLGTKKVKDKEIYIPATENEKIRVKKGDVYLTNDKEERKATGSYYTPDYIVQYIVRNTIEPIIQEKLKEFEDWQEQLRQKKKSELRKLIAQYRIPFDPKVYDNSGRIEGEKSIDAYRNVLLQLKDPAEAILKLKILDPAMGSGHFLVGAVDYLADRILEILAQTSDKQYFGNETYRSPLLEKLEDIRKRILDKNQKEGYEIDETKLEDKNLIKRIILKRCIYGVDINPLAVELAKVSLWLHTFTIGAPLSFLDHHLKCGNSLIGTDLKELEKALNGSIFGSHYYTHLIMALDSIKQLQELTDADISEVEESAKLYEEVEKQLEPLKKALDLYTSEFFIDSKLAFRYLNNDKNKSNNKKQKPWAWSIMEQYGPLKVVYGKISTSNGEQNLPHTDKEKIEQRLKLAREKRFFHWKIEFPEIWYENGREKKNGGFDIVIGNPPYVVEVRENKDIFKDLQVSPSVGKYYEDKMDMFYFFIERGIDLLKENGFLGFIVQEYWITRAKAQKLRRKIFTETKPIEFVLFKDFKVFKDAPGQHNMILMLRKSKINPKDQLHVKIIKPEVLKQLSKHIIGDLEKVIVAELNKQKSPVFESLSKELRLVYAPTTDKVYILNEKLPQRLERLKTNCLEGTFNLEQKEVNQGLVSNPPEAFIWTEHELIEKELTTDEKNLLKPFGSAECIDKFLWKDKGQRIAYITKDIDEKYLNNKCPNIFKRLKRYKAQLEERREVKENKIPWTALHWPRTKDLFEDPEKIVSVRKTKYPKFVVIKKPFYMDQSVFIIRLVVHREYSPYYLTALFNSKLGHWWLYNQKRQGDQLQVDKEVLINFPIPKIDFKRQNSSDLQKLRRHYEDKDFRYIEQSIKSFPSNFAILHDFLAFLAEKMTELHQTKYLIQLFIDGKLEDGSNEMIKVKKLLAKHPEWESNIPEAVEKEIAKNLIITYEEQIKYTGRLIDKVVYRLYGLNKGDIEVIENWAKENL